MRTCGILTGEIIEHFSKTCLEEEREKGRHQHLPLRCLPLSACAVNAPAFCLTSVYFCFCLSAAGILRLHDLPKGAGEAVCCMRVSGERLASHLHCCWAAEAWCWSLTGCARGKPHVYGVCLPVYFALLSRFVPASSHQPCFAALLVSEHSSNTLW